ncbi:MAG TPA: hypothetical protein VGO78_06015, partial [Acidimicrobiales bacterium]|nr:hypothetical protein [Acidimicrobiales bacterium]
MAAAARLPRVRPALDLTGRGPHDEIDSDADLVGRLLAAQQPQWAGLPVERIASTGADKALYRLGDDLVVRLPLRPSSVRNLVREARWL